MKRVTAVWGVLMVSAALFLASCTGTSQSSMVYEVDSLVGNRASCPTVTCRRVAPAIACGHADRSDVDTVFDDAQNWAGIPAIASRY